MTTPVLSVVTVCYNAAGLLKNTIESVLSQTARESIEYLIIDGGSTDDTVDVVRSYGNRIDTFVSERDQGIYDAMNKGASLAHGNWILFMNAGDFFASVDVVSDAALEERDCDILYGDCLVRYDGFRYLTQVSMRSVST